MCLSASCISSPLVTQNHLFPSNFHTLAYPCHIFILLSYSCHTKLSLSLQFSYFGSLHRDFTANARKSKADAVKWQFFADLKVKKRCVMLTIALLSSVILRLQTDTFFVQSLLILKLKQDLHRYRLFACLHWVQCIFKLETIFLFLRNPRSPLCTALQKLNEDFNGAEILHVCGQARGKMR